MSWNDHKQPTVKNKFSLVESSGKVDLWGCIGHPVFYKFILCYI